MEIELPKDAEGRQIPLDTKVLYNDRGAEYEVSRFTFGFDVITREGEWTAESYGTVDMVYHLPVNSMYLEKPDSLKQLAEDLNRVQAKHDANGATYRESACYYVGRLGATCKGCGLNRGDKTCFEAMMADIVSRVNRLAGDSE